MAFAIGIAFGCRDGTAGVVEGPPRVAPCGIGTPPAELLPAAEAAAVGMAIAIEDCGAALVRFGRIRCCWPPLFTLPSPPLGIADDDGATGNGAPVGEKSRGWAAAIE